MVFGLPEHCSRKCTAGGLKESWHQAPPRLRRRAFQRCSPLKAGFRARHILHSVPGQAVGHRLSQLPVCLCRPDHDFGQPGRASQIYNNSNSIPVSAKMHF
jgi:hypothetical protein